MVIRKKGAAKTVTITVRIPPKDRFLLEILGRRQRRNLTSVIEAAIANYLQTDDEIESVERNIWDVIASDRFAKLAMHYPELLTYEEGCLWKSIQTAYNQELGRNPYFMANGDVDLKKLREDWVDLMRLAAGKWGLSLPLWTL